MTAKLPALRAYQHSLTTPRLAVSRAKDAARGKIVFDANCSRCHVEGSLTDNNDGILHAPTETEMDPAYAARSLTKRYRTTPLRGLWKHPPYFHDGSARTLDDVAEHYARVLRLELDEGQKNDLVHYLHSL